MFASFDPEPLAAASMGQVHAATLSTGEEVVVKVRRPDVDVTIRGDLSVMRDVIDTTERRLKWFRKFGLGELFSEFAENVLAEIDYTDEAYHARLLRHNMQGFARVHVPKIYPDYSTDDVLTLERVRGVKITNTAAIDAAGINRQRLALDFFRALLQQVLFDGFFHADLHPGNVWVELPSSRVLFIDMGMMGYLSRPDRFLLAQMIWGLHDNDAPMVTRVLLRVCRPVADRDDRALGRDVARLMNRHLLFAQAMPWITVLIGERVGLLLASAFVLSLPLENRVSPGETLVIRRSATVGLVISAGLTVMMLLTTLWRMTRAPRQRSH